MTLVHFPFEPVAQLKPILRSSKVILSRLGFPCIFFSNTLGVLKLEVWVCHNASFYFQNTAAALGRVSLGQLSEKTVTREVCSCCIELSNPNHICPEGSVLVFFFFLHISSECVSSFQNKLFHLTSFIFSWLPVHDKYGSQQIGLILPLKSVVIELVEVTGNSANLQRWCKLDFGMRGEDSNRMVVHVRSILYNDTRAASD